MTHGIPYQYVKEVAPEATVFRLGMLYPLPEKRLREFCSRFEKVFVVEESEGFIQQEMASLGILNVIGKERFTNIGELSADLVAAGLKGIPTPADFAKEVAVLPRPPKMCAGCPHSGTFSALRKLKVLVTGDIGCYTLGCLPPLSAIDTTFCMGASIGNATGFSKAGEERVVAVIGDSTFLHSGLPSLMSAVYNQVPTTMILLDNSTTGMTGHQEHPGTGHTLQDDPAPSVDFEALIRAIGVKHVTVMDPWELKDMRRAVKDALAHPGPAVVIARRACHPPSRGEGQGEDSLLGGRGGLHPVRLLLWSPGARPWSWEGSILGFGIGSASGATSAPSSARWTQSCRWRPPPILRRRRAEPWP